ncbi:TetR/AcrR family transcriptional regulator [Actinomadura rupiterrae]|uniref:TetR/AcrR family transcriptional regulator n=1 Tax=Actinomadura rupiterrae TaxID=559627 RepID=UPI0020A2CB19|nr:TetR/AcrR family transcriptional regulator [Actinomadura rupiterrae]MCP2343417.1 AcrR family transcriptional regulator [Actinomadura rupiterrae]
MTQLTSDTSGGLPDRDGPDQVGDDTERPGEGAGQVGEGAGQVGDDTERPGKGAAQVGDSAAQAAGEDCAGQGVRKRDREATRRRLLDAARDLFGEHGYDNVTVRMIAAAADANVALVNRYFGSKAALFGEVLAGESALREVITATPDAALLPRRLAEHVVRQIHRVPPSPLVRMLDRSVGNPEVQGILRDHMDAVLVAPLVAKLDGPDRRVRAGLAAMVIMGGGPVRRMLDIADLRSADPEMLTHRLASMFASALA